MTMRTGWMCGAEKIMNERTIAWVDTGAIRKNAKYLKNTAGKPLMAVVKANGYGHGDVETARALQGIADWYGVALPEEGVRLRVAGICEPILVLGDTAPESMGAVFDYGLTPTVCGVESAKRFSEEALRRGKRISVHIAVDTGMGRLGFRGERAVEQISALGNLRGICADGIFTHFATADGEGDEYFFEQLACFRKILSELRERGINFRWVHAANSATLLRYPFAAFDMVRGGISIYGLSPCGLSPTGKAVPLEPALRWVTRIALVKTLPAGCGVGYGATFVTKRETRVATLPVGYADGYPRSLSGNFFVLIGGNPAPILGRICMDQMMVDVTDIPNVKIGDEATLLGKCGEREITAEAVGRACGSFSYEFLCRIGARVPRKYLGTWRQKEE